VLLVLLQACLTYPRPESQFQGDTNKEYMIKLKYKVLPKELLRCPINSTTKCLTCLPSSSTMVSSMNKDSMNLDLVSFMVGNINQGINKEYQDLTLSAAILISISQRASQRARGNLGHLEVKVKEKARGKPAFKGCLLLCLCFLPSFLLKKYQMMAITSIVHHAMLLFLPISGTANFVRQYCKISRLKGGLSHKIRRSHHRPFKA